jgi:hypothetical protein
MAHRLGKRIVRLCLLTLPLLFSLLFVFQNSEASPSHDHFVHDKIASVPEAIARLQSGGAVEARAGRFQAGVNAAPLGGPSETGQWTQVYNWPLVAVHTALLPDHKVLMWDAWEFGAAPSARMWDPYTQTFTAVPNTTSGLFCAGQVALADGRQFISGGHNGANYGINHTNIYDPVTDSWSRAANMNYNRWYPTTTLLGDGRVFVYGGEDTPGVFIHTPEIYNPVTDNWTTMPAASRPIGNYPLTFLAPDGRIFNVADNSGFSAYLNVNTQTWSDVGIAPLFYTSGVQYRPGKIMISGGTTSVGRGTAVIDLNQPSPSWRTTQSMAYARFQQNMVILADGQVMVIGGADKLDLASTTGVYQTELWNPTTETWMPLSPMQNLRMYHSSALLLPDARVLVMGGGRLAPAVDYPTAEIYSPPYLFRGPRPTISSAPAAAQYGQTITVQSPEAGSVASIALVRMATSTHSISLDQTYVPLNFTTQPSSLSVVIPSNSNVAPPGYYMLFLLTSDGVPSVAATIRISSETPPPSTPSATPSPGPSPTPSNTATLVGGTGSFPSTGLLDSFNRANGAIGASWSGANASYAIASNQLDVVSNGAIFWNTAFIQNQEVYVRAQTIDPDSSGLSLLLKAQNPTRPDDGVISVTYFPTLRVVRISTYSPTQGWVQRSSDMPMTLLPGDQFGARARTDGFVEVYRNGALVGTSDVRGWPLFATSGYIGVWVETSRCWMTLAAAMPSVAVSRPRAHPPVQPHPAAHPRPAAHRLARPVH